MLDTPAFQAGARSAADCARANKFRAYGQCARILRLLARWSYARFLKTVRSLGVTALSQTRSGSSNGEAIHEAIGER
jgi:hypothetical protein